jgi:hypothetical protein
MDKEQFWNIVNEVHSSTDPRNQKEVLAALRNRLRNLPSEEILEWKQIFSFYQDAARRNDLWAASAAMGAHSSDDGFMDFRSWLISQGHDVYMSALEDPESLVSVDTDGQELNFEDYAYVPYRAYAERRAYEEMSVGDILASYIEWSASEQQKQNDPAAGEKARPQKSTDFFMQTAMLGKYDLYDEMERRELPDDILRSLKEDIPQRGDIADGWEYEDLPRIMPKLSQRFQEKLERIEQRAKENTVPTQRRELKDKTLRRFLGTLPCTSQAEVNLLSDRMAEMTEQDETILSAMIEQHDPRTAERVLELMDDMKNCEVLAGVGSYKALGEYCVAQETNVPRELCEYLDLEALGKHYQEEYPGAFIGNDYVQFP